MGEPIVQSYSLPVDSETLFDKTANIIGNFVTAVDYLRTLIIGKYQEARKIYSLENEVKAIEFFH